MKKRKEWNKWYRVRLWNWKNESMHIDYKIIYFWLNFLLTNFEDFFLPGYTFDQLDRQSTNTRVVSNKIKEGETIFSIKLLQSLLAKHIYDLSKSRSLSSLKVLFKTYTVNFIAVRWDARVILSLHNEWNILRFMRLIACAAKVRVHWGYRVQRNYCRRGSRISSETKLTFRQYFIACKTVHHYSPMKAYLNRDT